MYKSLCLFYSFCTAFDDEEDLNEDSVANDIFTKTTEFSLVQEDPDMPDCPSVKLTMQLSASCERLNVIVEQGHEWVGPSL